MRAGIYARMTRNAWRRERFSAMSFIAFVTFSVAMISLTVQLFVNLSGAMEHLMVEAKTPDFLQMHTGEMDLDILENFAESHPEVRDYQLCGFLNFDNSMITLGKHSLVESTQDNGLSVQGKHFDYMVNSQNELPKVKRGQVYVPVCYQSMYDLKVGDSMEIGSETLEIAGFIRDSQMNSMMASSKRFLVSQEDYERLQPLGSEEYLIEFLLAEETDSNSFQTEYENAGLPMNGPTITRPLIKMMNTLSDGIMIFIILLVSMLVLLISLVCIRFMLLIQMEAEVSEVGMLKAIGISGGDIKKMFLRRYGWLIVMGTILGFALSFVMYRPLSKQMIRLYGVASGGAGGILFGVLGAGVPGCLILLFVSRVMKKLNGVSAIQVLTGRGANTKEKQSRICITIVTAVGIFLMMVPANLYSTLSSSEFVTYMGIGNGEIRMDIRQGENMDQTIAGVKKRLSEDESVEAYAMYQTSSTSVILKDGTKMNMLMEKGDHTTFPVSYSQGRTPDREGEVALSYMLSQELGLQPGDVLQVKGKTGYEMCKVTGVYSDITNGGKTAKMFAEDFDSGEDVMWSIAYVTLKKGQDQQAFMDAYGEDGVEIVDIASRIQGTYGPTLEQIKRVSVLVKVVSAAIILLVILLFVRLLLANQRNQISMEKALGFCNSDIKRGIQKSCLPYLVVGIIGGTVGGCILGEDICGLALQSLGASNFKFDLSVGMVATNLVVSTVAAVLAICLGTKEVENIRAVECCRGRE